MERRLQGVRIVREFRQPAIASEPILHTTLHAEGRSRPFADSLDAAYEIQRTDLRKVFRIFGAKRQYQEIPIFSMLSVKEQEAVTRRSLAWRDRTQPRQTQIRPNAGKAPDWKITIERRKTGDQTSMFGCLSVNWRTVVTEMRGQEKTETVTDAWYLDPEDVARLFPGLVPEPSSGCFSYITVNNEHPEIQSEGETPSGLCVFSETGTHSMEVLEISRESFAESVFEPPRGFRKLPLYPSRFTMMRLNVMRTLNHLRTSRKQGSAPRA